MFVAVGLLAGCGDSGTETNPEPEGEVLLESGTYIVAQANVLDDGCGVVLLDSLTITAGEDPHDLTIDFSLDQPPAEVSLNDSKFTLDVDWQTEVALPDSEEVCVLGVSVIIDATATDTQTFEAGNYLHALSLVSGPADLCEQQVQTEIPGFSSASGCEEIVDLVMVRESEE